MSLVQSHSNLSSFESQTPSELGVGQEHTFRHSSQIAARLEMNLAHHIEECVSDAQSVLALSPNVLLQNDDSSIPISVSLADIPIAFPIELTPTLVAITASPLHASLPASDLKAEIETLSNSTNLAASAVAFVSMALVESSLPNQSTSASAVLVDPLSAPSISASASATSVDSLSAPPPPPPPSVSANADSASSATSVGSLSAPPPSLRISSIDLLSVLSLPLVSLSVPATSDVETKEEVKVGGQAAPDDAPPSPIHQLITTSVSSTLVDSLPAPPQLTSTSATLCDSLSALPLPTSTSAATSIDSLLASPLASTSSSVFATPSASTSTTPVDSLSVLSSQLTAASATLVNSLSAPSTSTSASATLTSASASATSVDSLSAPPPPPPPSVSANADSASSATSVGSLSAPPPSSRASYINPFSTDSILGNSKELTSPGLSAGSSTRIIPPPPPIAYLSPLNSSDFSSRNSSNRSVPPSIIRSPTEPPNLPPRPVNRTVRAHSNLENSSSVELPRDPPRVQRVRSSPLQDDEEIVDVPSQSLNVSKIVESVQQLSSIYEQMEKLTVTLLLGETGAGKTTAVNFLAGRKFSEQKVEVELTVKGKVMKLRKTTIECLDPLPGSTPDQLLQLYHTEKGLHVCEPLGLEDTRTPGADIANATAISNVLRRAEKVVILILVKWNSLEEKGQGLKKLIEYVSKFLPSITETNFSSLRCVFTHVPNDKTYDDIAAKVAELLQSDLTQAHSLFPKFLEWLLEVVVAQQETVVLRPLVQEFQPLHDLIVSTPGLPSLDMVSPLNQDATLLLAQFCSEVAVAGGSLSARILEPPSYKQMLMNLKVMAQETRLPELKSHWSRYEAQLQSLSSELIPQIQEFLDQRAFFDTEQQLVLLERVQEVLGKNLLEPVIAKVGVLCHESLSAIATSNNLLNFASNFSDTKTLEDRLSRILPGEYKDIHEQCLSIGRETVEKYKERLEEVVDSNDFEQVTTELDSLLAGIESCSSFLDCSRLREEIFALVRQRVTTNNSVVQQFLKDWNFDYDQAPELIVEEEGVFTAYTIPLLVESIKKATPPLISRSIIPASSYRAKSARKLGAEEPESQEDDKTGVIMLEGRKKFTVEVKVGREFGRKVEWSFAIPDGNKVTFTVSFRDAKGPQKPVMISTIACTTHAGKYEVPAKAEGMVIFVWENKGGNLLKSPKPIQFAYAIHVWATNVRALAPPPPPPPPLPEPLAVPEEVKVEDPVWLAVVADELVLPWFEIARNINVKASLFSAFRALSFYRSQVLIVSIGDEIIEGMLMLQNFVEDAKSRFTALQNQWNEKNFKALSCSVWRVWVLRHFLNPELKDLASESKDLYDHLFKASVSIFQQLSTDAKKAPVRQIIQTEEAARVWLMLKLQHQKDLIGLLRQARIAVLERLSQFFRAFPKLDMKSLASQYVESVAPFRASYPVAFGTLTNHVVQRFISQMADLESNLLEEATLRALEDVFGGIRQFQAYERYGDIKTEADEIISNYKRVLKKIDTILVEMSDDLQREKRFLDALFLAFSCFSNLKTQSELSPDYVYGVAILEKLVSDPVQSEHLRAFLQWSKINRPEWFQCVVEIIDDAVPPLPNIFALFPGLYTQFKDLTPLRDLLGRMRQLNELCQGSSVALRQTLDTTRAALDQRLLQLLIALRKVRPPPPTLTVLIAGCASDDLIGSISFNEEWDLALNKLQRDSALCQRGWKEFIDILQDCRRKADGRRLLVVLDKPLFDIFRIIWRANVPFSVFHAMAALGDWWAKEVKAGCVEQRASLEEKAGVVRLQLQAEALMSVRTLWKGYFILKTTIANLETAKFISSNTIDGFSLSALRQWLLDFLDKLVVLGTTAVNGLHLSVVNQLFHVFNELESLIAMQPNSETTSTATELLMDVCCSRIHQLKERFQEDKSTSTRCKLLLDVRRFCIAIDQAGLTKLVHTNINEMLSQTDPAALIEIGVALETDPLGLRLIHECHHFHLERTRLYNRLTGGMPFGLALEEMQRRTEPYYPLDAAKLSVAWNRYRDVSSPLMKALLDQKLELKDLVANAKRLSSGRDIPAILAHVCGVYSMLKSKGVVKTMNDTPTPHPTQILSLFVLLLDALVVMLLDETKETHLLEMEAGKSLLLGLLATMLAVQGFEVHVACYSKVLADKGRKHFADIFEAFDIKDQVKYDTIGGLVNHTLMEVGDIRTMTQALLVEKERPPPPPLPSAAANFIFDEDDNPLPPPPPPTPSTKYDPLFHPPPPTPSSTYSSLALRNRAETYIPSAPPSPQASEDSEHSQPPPPPPIPTTESFFKTFLMPEKLHEEKSPPPPPKLPSSSGLWDDDDNFLETSQKKKKQEQKTPAKSVKNFSLFGDDDDMKNASTRPRVLLMDDAVLMQKEVHGCAERLDLIMRSPAIIAICNYIFENRDRALRLSMLQKLDIYSELQREFKSEAQSLLNSSLGRLLADVKKIDQPAYAYTLIEVDGRLMLGYHTRKGFDTETCYRGITMFQYMQEHARGRIDVETLSQKVGLYICCGAYAYVEMLNNYQRVFGVTGVYEQLEDMDKIQLRESFNVHQVTLASSMYGYRKDRLEKQPVRVLTSDDAQFLAIRETVDNIRKTAIERKTKIPPILIMFENEGAIKKFTSQILNAQWIADLHRDCFVVRLGSENVDYALTKSMLPGGVTLFPASLACNLDFQCFEQDIDEQCGVHVVQTFLSFELRDEIQIQNRTACGKHKGTFIRLFSLVQLKSLFGVVDTDVLRPHMDPEPILQRARQDFYSAQKGERQQRVLETKRMHERTSQYLEALLEDRASLDFLRLLNAPPTLQVRLLVLVEATVAMRAVWIGLKAIVDPLILRLEEFLGGLDNFKLKFVAFRDYDCDGHVTDSSSWMNEPALMSTWLESIDLIAHDTVAMEAVLRVANEKESPPTRVLLFGNSPPRAMKVEECHPYVLECKELCNQGISVFTYHMEGAAAPVYENIASLTNGTSTLLWPEELLDIIAVNALDDIAL